MLHMYKLLQVAGSVLCDKCKMRTRKASLSFLRKPVPPSLKHLHTIIAGLHLPHFLVEIYEGVQALTAVQPSKLAATHLFVQTASSATLSRQAGLVLENVPLSTKVVAYSKTGMPRLHSWPCHLHMNFISRLPFLPIALFLDLSAMGLCACRSSNWNQGQRGISLSGLH
jgi:hypothetical protein